ncbi:hypothetical protein [Streptomyces sp. AM 2-1-1]|uniref:hypothetical protein n=1 Tax=Streptomyces sp. AM 2-1-1 TaxID=3028709 RepID=UPI0023B95CD2|nr:hypothetical protein [Streptomyces sp. AM 2-1-1]WEH39212.1 hypothetical protein PZB77_06575 [Streptomyces sp. AM 2-1-1]
MTTHTPPTRRRTPIQEATVRMSAMMVGTAFLLPGVVDRPHFVPGLLGVLGLAVITRDIALPTRSTSTPGV